MNFICRIGLLAGILALAGCSSVDRRLAEAGLPKGGPVLGAAAGIGVLNLVYQPFEANWDVADIALSPETHRLALRMKRFTTGGEGEAWQTTRRYVERLQAAKGASSYVIVEFTTGIDSSTPFARRVGEALVRFSGVPPEPVAAAPAAVVSLPIVVPDPGPLAQAQAAATVE